jgi:hypothetical protein
MAQDKRVETLLHIRKLRGGSQPILARANDGYFYVVKFLDNPQGANLLYNEAVGSEIYRSVGLPTPEWRPVYVSEEFLDQNPACWMETETGFHKPKSGWAFGSRFVSLRNSSLFEIIPGQSFSRIRNRRDFWTAWVLDVFCGHADNRQVVFLERESKWLEAYFIDHGHLFGGARGTGLPSFIASRYLDPRIYAATSTQEVEQVVRAIQKLDLAAISHVANSLPDEWITETALWSFAQFKRRISDAVLLQSVVHFVVGMVEATWGGDGRRPVRNTSGYNRTDLPSQIPPSGVDDPVVSRGGDLAGDPGRRKLEALRPSYLQAAGF